MGLQYTYFFNSIDTLNSVISLLVLDENALL